MSVSLTRTQIYIQPELLKKAKQVAKNNHKNLSQLIRESLEKSVLEILNQETKNKTLKAKKPLKTLNLKNKGITTIALNHNDIYD